MVWSPLLTSEVRLLYSLRDYTKATIIGQYKCMVICMAKSCIHIYSIIVLDQPRLQGVGCIRGSCLCVYCAV